MRIRLDTSGRAARLRPSHFAAGLLKEGSMRLLACRALTAILLACPLVALADEAEDAFNKLYEEDLKRVAATPMQARKDAKTRWW